MKKVISNILTIVSVAMIVWLLLSFVDVNIHNNPAAENYQQFAQWNLFKLFLF
jgi:uncharacterized membrane protein